MITFVLLVAALVFFLLGAISVPLGRVNTIAVGLALWVLSVLLAGR